MHCGGNTAAHPGSPLRPFLLQLGDMALTLCLNLAALPHLISESPGLSEVCYKDRLYAVLGMESRDLCMLGKYSTN